MAVAIDSQEVSNAGHNSAASPLTWAFNNVAGTFLLVAVVVTQAVGAFGNLTISATYNGVAMTFGPSLNNWNVFQNDYIVFFYLANPALGSHTVSVASTGASIDIIAAAISFTGVNLASPIAQSGNSSGNGTPTAVTLTGTTGGNYVVSVAGTGTSFIGAVAPTLLSAIKNVSANTGSDNLIMGQQAAGGDVSASFSDTADIWGQVAIELAAAPATVVNLPPYVPPMQHYVEEWWAVHPV